jgi:hypothetical protein
MSKLELKISDGAQASTTEITKDSVVVENKGFKQRIPSNWTIVANGDGIIATSNMGDRFEGSVKDFNKALKVQ